MSKATVAILVFFGLAAPASAQAAHKHPKRCTHGRVLKVERVARHRHGKTVHVKVRYCAKRKTKPKPATVAPATIPPPTAAAAAPAKTVKLHAHLDPTVTRNPSNPFAVSYAYSASATSEPVGTFAVSSEPVPLPPGVLTLYNEGLLACSINVGGETTGGQCPVEYKTLGEHTVTTIYTAGEASATETETENIEPYATTTTVSASYEQLAVSVAEHVEKHVEQELACGGCGPRSRTITTRTTWTTGYLTVAGEAADAFGALPVRVGDDVGDEAGIVAISPHAFPVDAHEEEVAHEVCHETIQQTTECEPWGTPTYGSFAPPQEATVRAQAVVGPGFLPSEASTTISFDAQLIYPEGEEP